MPPRPVLRSLDEFDQWLVSTHGDDQGYAEVSNSGSHYPLLTYSFRGPVAVVHCFPSPEQVFLLLGDGVLADGEARDFPVIDIECAFSGVFISRVDYARRIVREVLGVGSMDGIGRWELM